MSDADQQQFAPGTNIRTRDIGFLIAGITGDFLGSRVMDSERLTELVKREALKIDSKLNWEALELSPAKTKLIANTVFGFKIMDLFITMRGNSKI